VVSRHPTRVSASPARRAILLLALCQAMAMTGNSILGTTAAIVGNMLATNKALSTLPIALQMTGTMAATVPAALLMARIGRRGGFWAGAAIGLLGAVIAGLAVAAGSFLGFCAGTTLLGAHNGVVQQYRFAASEMADERTRSRAISLVLAGGVVSALFGPETAKWSRDLFLPAAFAGCYAVIAVLCLAVALLLCLVRLPKPPPVAWRGGGRPLIQIAREPVFLVAAFAAMVGYGVMSLVMTATPITMLGCGFGFADAAFVIQWHALGMYAPSFVTGRLITRFGLTRILLAGALLLVVSAGISLSGLAKAQFWAALVLLGIGWNFLFVGATTLLARAHAPAEKAKVQALNDFLIFGTVAVSSFSSGALLAGPGWRVIQLAALPLAIAAIAAVLWLKTRPAGAAEPRWAEP
jgi:MFS family permease